jgi:hypothetical protein
LARAVIIGTFACVFPWSAWLPNIFSCGFFCRARNERCTSNQRTGRFVNLYSLRFKI